MKVILTKGYVLPYLLPEAAEQKQIVMIVSLTAEHSEFCRGTLSCIS